MLDGDWSSDVCSSDLVVQRPVDGGVVVAGRSGAEGGRLIDGTFHRSLLPSRRAVRLD
jgi:hypothetical protein